MLGLALAEAARTQSIALQQQKHVHQQQSQQQQHQQQRPSTLRSSTMARNGHNYINNRNNINNSGIRMDGRCQQPPQPTNTIHVSGNSYDGSSNCTTLCDGSPAASGSQWSTTTTATTTTNATNVNCIVTAVRRKRHRKRPGKKNNAAAINSSSNCPATDGTLDSSCRTNDNNSHTAVQTGNNNSNNNNSNSKQVLPIVEVNKDIYVAISCSWQDDGGENDEQGRSEPITEIRPSQRKRVQRFVAVNWDNHIVLDLRVDDPSSTETTCTDTTNPGAETKTGANGTYTCADSATTTTAAADTRRTGKKKRAPCEYWTCRTATEATERLRRYVAGKVLVGYELESTLYRLRIQHLWAQQRDVATHTPYMHETSDLLTVMLLPRPLDDLMQHVLKRRPSPDLVHRAAACMDLYKRLRHTWEFDLQRTIQQKERHLVVRQQQLQAQQQQLQAQQQQTMLVSRNRTQMGQEEGEGNINDHPHYLKCSAASLIANLQGQPGPQSEQQENTRSSTSNHKYAAAEKSPPQRATDASVPWTSPANPRQWSSMQSHQICNLSSSANSQNVASRSSPINLTNDQATSWNKNDNSELSNPSFGRCRQRPLGDDVSFDGSSSSCNTWSTNACRNPLVWLPRKPLHESTHPVCHDDWLSDDDDNEQPLAAKTTSTRGLQLLSSSRNGSPQQQASSLQICELQDLDSCSSFLKSTSSDNNKNGASALRAGQPGDSDSDDSSQLVMDDDDVSFMKSHLPSKLLNDTSSSDGSVTSQHDNSTHSIPPPTQDEEEEIACPTPSRRREASNHPVDGTTEDEWLLDEAKAEINSGRHQKEASPRSSIKNPWFRRNRVSVLPAVEETSPTVSVAASFDINSSDISSSNNNEKNNSTPTDSTIFPFFRRKSSSSSLQSSPARQQQAPSSSSMGVGSLKEESNVFESVGDLVASTSATSKFSLFRRNKTINCAFSSNNNNNAAALEETTKIHEQQQQLGDDLILESVSITDLSSPFARMPRSRTFTETTIHSETTSTPSVGGHDIVDEEDTYDALGQYVDPRTPGTNIGEKQGHLSAYESSA